MIDRTHPLPHTLQAEALRISRGAVYYGYCTYLPIDPTILNAMRSNRAANSRGYHLS